MEVVGEDANAGGADVAAQLDVGLGVFDRGFERDRVRGIEAGRADPNSGISPEVEQALPDLVDRIWSEFGHA